MTHPQKSVFRDYAETILICVIFVIFSRAFVFQQSKIPSGSMEDTLLIGDYIMVNRFVYARTSFDWERLFLPIKEIERGDIVVFKQPQRPEVDYIKRVAGLPGDLIEVQNGRLFVNGELVDEPWVAEAYQRKSVVRQRPIRVEPGHYFMLGDHRNNSEDSRVWGQVERGLIKGRALLIWYSFAESDPSSHPSLTQRFKSWGEKLIHFPRRTRWSRIFSIIY